MAKIILYVVVLAILVAIAVWFAETPGAVSLEWHGWRIDTSVAMLFAIVAALLAIGTFLVRAWSTLVGAGRAFRDARKDKRMSRGLDALAKGFAAVRGGDPAAAVKAGREARSSLGDLAGVRFLDQQTERVSGNRSGASANARALLDEPTMELAALRDLAEIAQQAGDREGALAHALRALEWKPPPRWACTTVLDLQVALEHWEAAAATIERKDLQGAFDTADERILKSVLFSRAASATLAKQDFSSAIKWARKALSADPERVDASAALGRALTAEGKAKKAASELERAWAVIPHPLVLSAYLQIVPAEAPLARAGRVEKLVSGNPDHPESRLALADVALAAELWGQARSRLEPLLDTGTAPHVRAQAAALMACVDLGDGENTKSATQSLITALKARSDRREASAPTSVSELLARSL